MAWTPFLLLFFLPFSTLAQSNADRSPLLASFDDCFTGNQSLKLNVSTVYAQYAQDPLLGKHINLTVLGTTPQEIIGLANGSTSLATLFTTTDALTFNVWFNSSYFCNALRPASPLPTTNTSDYCPLPAGPFAFSSMIPLGTQDFELLTLQTRLRAVDSLTNELICIDVDTTPLAPGVLDSTYGHARVILWCTVALTAAFWIVVGGARLSFAWGRRSGWAGRGLWSRVETLGFVVASAVSGEAFAKTPALLRFATPSMRDIFLHAQWCTAVAMVAVQWPQFVYPILSQTAWATLSYNVTLTQPTWRHWDPLSTPPFNPPSDFADQLADPSSPLFINTTLPNTLYALPANATAGLSSLAYTIGLYPEDLFGVCIVLFLGILAGTISISLVLWAIDGLAAFVSRLFVGGRNTQGGYLRSPRYSSASKEMLDAASPGPTYDEDRSVSANGLLKKTARLLPLPKSTRTHWPRLFPDFYGSFHFSVLHGNLVRILILFHLPITIFSSYQMTMGRGQASLGSIVLAAICFAGFSVVIPGLLVARLSLTSTSKLYEETRTLLSVGPLYNQYRQGSQFYTAVFFAVNLALGLTIGCGQKSGTAQAIVILIIEVMSALFTSVWLPWGHGASMGLISFLFCVARIVVAVLLVTLTPTVSIGGEAGQWVTYVILFILGLVYLSFLLMFVCKIIEAFIRIAGGAGFDRSRSTTDSGLLGACAMAGCCGARRKPSRRSRSKQSDAPLPLPTTQSYPRLPKDHTPSHSGPPSVLKPEHALRPYKEDADDESGFIMSAWHRPGYEALNNEPAPRLDTPTTPQKSSGFSRVAGGRAHFDSPYAIASSSTVSFPSVERMERPTPTTSQRNSTVSMGSATAPPPSSMMDVERAYNLPPGAMPPHMRKKSQSAVIEHIAGMVPAASSSQQPAPVMVSARRQSLRPEIVSPDTEDDQSDSENAPTSKKWFQWKSRRHSDGEEARSTAPATTGDDIDTGGGRTFLGVRRKRRASALEPSQIAQDEAPLELETPKKSFVVIRSGAPGRSPAGLATPGAGPSGTRR